MANELVVSAGGASLDRIREAMGGGLPLVLWANRKMPAEALPALDAAMCAQVVQLCAEHSAPSGRDEAAKLAQLLIGSFPRHQVDDPAIYARALVSVLAEYPRWCAIEAIDRITRASHYLPARSDVAKACEAVMEPVREISRVAQVAIDNAEKRARKAADDAMRQADREDFQQRHGSKSPLDVLREQGKWSDDDSERETK